MISLLPDTVLSAAEGNPNKVAFRCGREQLTYAETALKIRQTAAVLHQLGIRRGDRVGVCLNRSIISAFALHGIMHAGAVYVPLDPKAPAERLLFQLEDCGVEVLVTSVAQAKLLARAQVQKAGLKRTVGLSAPLDDVANFSWEEVFAISVDPEHRYPSQPADLAYIMYTSGSTGKPKGIMHTHASGLAFARLFAKTYGVTARDVVGGHAPIYFDMSTPALFVAPLAGATAVIVSDGHTIFPASMAALIEAEAITVWYSVPLALTQMLQSKALEGRQLPALRWIVYAGEPFAPKYIRELMQLLPTANISNAYGPAETNVCTYYHLPAPPVGDAHVSIGQVWEETADLILNPEGEVVTDGTAGELLISSSTMMEGYWNRPDLTARRFYRAAGDPESTLYYRTGDRVQRDATGNLHFLGRIDNQVKVRGYRIELDAVESKLLAHEEVAEAVVLALPNTAGTLQLHAFVILQPAATLTPKGLRDFASQSLTWYALPEEITFVTTLPRTGSGKISRPKLRAQLAQRE